jgi:hypothetical protein
MSKKRIWKELKEHIPFTAMATLTAILFVLFIIFFLQRDFSKEFFHVLHPMHVFISAMVTSAIFYKYKKRFLPAFLIGIIGAILIGSLSDIIFPYLGGSFLQLNTAFHLPILENTPLILFVAAAGGVFGISTVLTKFPHFLHVFLSVFASLFYLLAFSATFNPLFFIGSFIVVFISVIIPCCLSDIIFPLLFLGKK